MAKTWYRVTGLTESQEAAAQWAIDQLEVEDDRDTPAAKGGVLHLPPKDEVVVALVDRLESVGDHDGVRPGAARLLAGRIRERMERRAA